MVMLMEEASDSMIFVAILTLFLASVVFLAINQLIRSQTVKDYQQKYVLISNGDTFLAKDLALRLVNMGFHVFVGRHPSLDSGHNDESSHHLVYLTLNPSDPVSVQNAVKAVSMFPLVAKKGLWALINTSSTKWPALPCQVPSIQDYSNVLDANLYTPIEMCRHFLPLLRRSVGGRIINITVPPSCTPFMSLNQFPYSVAMNGLEGYSDMLRRELYRQGVYVCIVQADAHNYNYNQHRNNDNATDHVTQAEQQLTSAGGDVRHLYRSDDIQHKLPVWNAGRQKSSSSPSSSSDMSQTVQTVVSAVTDRFPGTRYVVGGHVTKIVSRVYHLLPDWLVDSRLYRKLLDAS